MATVDKQSLREEFDKIKTQFKQQTQESHVSKEVVALFNSLIMLFEMIMVIFLERKTSKTSKNSSKPSSQTGKDETSTGQAGSQTKGKAEHNQTAANTRTVETVTLLPVTECAHCGASLQDVPCQCVERRTRIDILFEKTVEHFDAESKTCTCGHVTKAKHPKDMYGPLQYGVGIKAYVIHLIIAQMISLNRTQKMLKTLIGSILSEATLLSYIMQLHIALADW